MNWVKIDSQTKAAQVADLGCLVKVGSSLCFIPKACIQDGALKAMKQEVTVTASSLTSTQPDKALKAADLSKMVGEYAQKTWRIAFTKSELNELSLLIRAKL